MGLLKRFTWTVGVASVLATGCVPVTEIHLFNHFSQEVVVSTCSGSVTVPPNGSITLSTYKCSFERGPQVVIASAGVQWKYENALWRMSWVFEQAPSFAEHKLPAGYRVNAQLEPDGSIYIVKPNTPLPVQELSNALRIVPGTTDGQS